MKNCWPHSFGIWVFSITLIFSVPGASAQRNLHSVSTIRRIEIAPVWTGTEESTKKVVVVVRDHDAFLRIWYPEELFPENNVLRITAISASEVEVQDSQPKIDENIHQELIDTKLVSNLLVALKSAPMPHATLANLGISPAWQSHFAKEQVKYIGSIGELSTERQKAYAEKVFSDRTLLNRLLPRILGTHWIDDPAWVQVKIVFNNGNIWTAQTDHQPGFMLPWSCHRSGIAFQTYNANLSRAIAALLPEKAVNRNRLAGVELDKEVRLVMASAIKKQWQDIGAEDLAGESLGKLKKTYVLRRSEVSSYISLEYGTDKWGEGPKQNFLKADVRRPIFPKGLVVATIFPITNGRPEGISDFLHNGHYYENIVLSTPWLMESLRKFEDVGAWLSFVRDVSMSEKAVQIFTKDMHKLGRDDLARDVSEHRKEVALLNYNGNLLIVFPDHHAIVWRWGRWRKLFRWPAEDLATTRCENYPTATEGCVAAVISSDGHLIK